MTEKTPSKWHYARLGRGEVVGGGFFVFRRGETTGRIKVNPAKLPFEHGTLEAAQREAKRLAAASPGITFSIFQQVGERLVAATPGSDGESA